MHPRVMGVLSQTRMVVVDHRRVAKEVKFMKVEAKMAQTEGTLVWVRAKRV